MSNASVCIADTSLTIVAFKRATPVYVELEDPCLRTTLTFKLQFYVKIASDYNFNLAVYAHLLGMPLEAFCPNRILRSASDGSFE